MARPVRWRLAKLRRPGGDYHVLTKGKKTPVNLTLGYIPQRAAETALRRMQEALERGDDDRIARLYDTPVLSWGAGCARMAERAHTRAKELCVELGLPVPERPADPDAGVDGRTIVLGYLLSEDLDDYLHELLGTAPIDYGRMSLREYWEGVFWPERTREVAKTTWMSDANRYKHMMATSLGEVRLDRLDAWIFESYLEDLAERGLGGRTRALHRAAYQAILNFAHRRGHIRQKHDFFQIRGATKRSELPEPPLTAKEASAIIRHETDPMRVAMWGVAIGQGLRPSELG